MPATRAKGGFKTLIYRGDGASPTEGFSPVAEILDIGGPEASQATEDATNMDSDGWEEKIAIGLKAAGDISFQMHLLQDDASQNGLWQDLNSSTRRNYRIVFPSQTKRLSVTGFIAKINHSFPVKGKMVHDVTITLTGPIIREVHP